jgi:PII-like signaling protein
VLSVVDSEEKLKGFMPILDQMVQQGLVVLSNVDIVKYTHNYQKSERRREERL